MSILLRTKIVKKLGLLFIAVIFIAGVSMAFDGNGSQLPPKTLQQMQKTRKEEAAEPEKLAQSRALSNIIQDFRCRFG